VNNAVIFEQKQGDKKAKTITKSGITFRTNVIFCHFLCTWWNFLFYSIKMHKDQRYKWKNNYICGGKK
jgi:hypothetical protein